MFDGEAFGREIVEAVKSHIALAMAPLEQRLAALESRPPPEKGDPGDKGEPGEKGDKGDPGADGFGFDDLAVDYDGARSFAIRFTQGERVKAFDFQVPVMIYRGAWSAEECYGQGDTVTWAGSLWHCNAATAAMPDEGVAGWTRAVRRGRDGKNGKDGLKGDKGEPGRAGRDLIMDAPR